MSKAAASDADTIMIDLEDAVFPDQKDQSRAVAINAIDTCDWGDKRLLVRVNGLDTAWGFTDIIDLAARNRLDGILVPKIESADDVRFAGRLLTSLNQRRRGNALELHILIESARAVCLTESILQAGPRITSASFGSGDYAISVGALEQLTGAPPATANSISLPFHESKARFVTACHAFHVVPLDGPHPSIADTAGSREACRIGRSLGFLGKWAIHPAHIAIINDAFKVAPEVRAWARRVVDTLAAAKAQGVGAATLDGTLVEAAHLLVAERILADE